MQLSSWSFKYCSINDLFLIPVHLYLIHSDVLECKVDAYGKRAISRHFVDDSGATIRTVNDKCMPLSVWYSSCVY